jgi:potassium voltage-gated channel Eag-related subfamily H member 2
LASTGKDDIFGEDMKKSYFDETRRIGKSLYTVRSISYCDLHKIIIDDLQDIMDAYPEFAGDFLQNFGVTFNLREVKVGDKRLT